MVVNPEDRSSRIEAQIISMHQFHFPQIDIFSSKYHVQRLSVFKRYEHRGHVGIRYGYTSSACSNSAQDFSVPPTFI